MSQLGQNTANKIFPLPVPNLPFVNRTPCGRAGLPHVGTIDPMTEENKSTCEDAPPEHYHYWYRLQMPRDEVYVKCPTVFVDRRAARRGVAG